MPAGFSYLLPLPRFLVCFCRLHHFCLCLVVRCLRCLKFLMASDVHCVDLHCVWVCPRFAHPALITKHVVRSRLTLRSMSCFNPWCVIPQHTIPYFMTSLMKSQDCCSYLEMSRSKESISRARFDPQNLLSMAIEHQACSTTVCSVTATPLSCHSTRSEPFFVARSMTSFVFRCAAHSFCM